jgi:tRNA 2-selenouridine synthase
MLSSITDLQSLLLHDTPLMDVRAPVEFARGAFPGAVNLPLLNDDERAQVGTCYKTSGQDAAIALGHQLVQGDSKDRRISAWLNFARANPEGVLYCFRGGLRSQITQQWMAEAGIPYPRVAGGYKALRTLLIESLESWTQSCQLIVIGGLTGTGKTELIRQLAEGIDLEGYARHRGSSFGQRNTPQPSQIDFENALAIDALRKRTAGIDLFAVEDEGRHIGICSLPDSLLRAMERAPILWLEDDFESRVNRILHDYVIQQAADFIATAGPIQGWALYADNLQQGLMRLRKRLGNERYGRLASYLDTALAQQHNTGDTALHQQWIAPLLQEYYDPMYNYQRMQKTARVVASGSASEIRAWISKHTHQPR